MENTRNRNHHGKWIDYPLNSTLSGGMPSHGLLKVHSSHIITPRLKMSHFSVNGSFRMSSGAIHSGVPADEESLIGDSIIILESPKSQILTVQCLFTRQFALFRSRWTIFIRCMHIRPLHTTKVFISMLYAVSNIVIQLSDIQIWNGAIHHLNYD